MNPDPPGTTEAEAILAQFRTRLLAGEVIDPDAAPSPPAAVTPERESAVSLDGPPGPDASMAVDALHRLAGTTPGMDRYQRIEEVARGGMGVVWKVRDETLHRTLALKVMLGVAPDIGPGKPDLEPRMLARFLEEAQIAAQLDHPGIVPVHELGVAPDGCPYFTMRFVRGRDLGQVLGLVQRGEEGWNVTRALGVLLMVCETMAFAHAKGVVHRDLKPANVMVGRFGEVYVMDWGLARVLGREASPDTLQRDDSTRYVVASMRRRVEGGAPTSPLHTMDGDILGTPAYMPPEQARGRLDALGPRADVYSLGAMLYHLLTGHMPFLGKDAEVTQHAVLLRLREGPPRPVHELNPAVPAELVAICEKAMARDPEQRYPDMTALADDLRAFLERRVVAAYETGAVAELRKWMARNKALALACAAAILFALGGLSWVLAVESRANREIGHALDRALANERVAIEEKQKVLRLADAKRLAERVAEARTLWPAMPEMVARLETWLQQAEELVLNLPEHQRTLALLRERAVPPERPGTGDRRPWRFADTESQWQHDILEGLVNGIEDLTRDDVRGETMRSVQTRLELARTVHKLTVEDQRAKWDAAIRSIADRTRCPKYDGLGIRAQIGLVPLWQDPGSELWEFAHFASGAVPARDDAGRLAINEDIGIVLVLIPGGTLRMGSPETEPGRLKQEGPVHDVVVAPFFLSKLELTQAQWQRITGKNPSYYGLQSTMGGKRHTLLHPVEQVPHQDCVLVLSWLGLDLPTEAQWEHAARGGTASAWWTGDDSSQLEGAENLADAFCRTHGGPPDWRYEPWDDGYVTTAPVGSFNANAFGVHDMLGNVSEWCLEVYSLPTVQGPGPDPTTRVVRGGCFASSAVAARVARRQASSATTGTNNLGVRPTRRLVVD